MKIYINGYTKMEDEKLKKLYSNIIKDRGKPLDFWEIAALLEVYGIRDIDAKNDYGFEDTFEMAKYMQKFVDDFSYDSVDLATFEKVPNFRSRIIKNYIKGLAFAMPMLVQIFFTLAVGYAIWSGMEMGKTKATVIALGTFLALLVTGGSAQAIGRKGLFYLKQEQYILASIVTKFLVKVSVVIIFFIGTIFIFLNFLFEILPPYYFFVFIAFYFLLSLFFLNISVFQMFEEYNTILGFFLVGMVFVYIFHTIEGVGLPEAQFLALLILNFLISIYTYYRLNKLEKVSKGEGEVVPRNSIMFYTLIPFFMYGFLYFTFLIVDKVIAWSVFQDTKPYFIWFDVPYELGVDWALLVLIFLVGMAEVSIYEFIYRINSEIKTLKCFEYRKFNDKLKSFYDTFNIIFLLFSFFIIFFVYFIFYFLYQTYDVKYLADFFISYTPYVYWMASVAYIFLVHALINVLFIFSFSRQLFVTKSTAIAVFVNVVVGMILSRALSLEYAVVGLLTGSIVFWYYSFNYSKKMFKDLDFYYYSSI